MHSLMAKADPEHVCRLTVFYNHKVVGDYPDTYTFELDGQALAILNDSQPRKRVKLFVEGSWSGAGVDLHCAFHVPDPDCKVCHPPIPAETLIQEILE